MKRAKKRAFKIKKAKPKELFDIKQTFAFKILLIFLFILILLILVYIFVYEPKEKERGFEGELRTLCIFCPENTVQLTVLNYTLFSNSGIYVNINWSAGNFNGSDFKAILVDFKMRTGANCNYTIGSELLNFGENKTYLITNFNPGCPETNFSNIANVFAYAEVEIHLTQRGLIPSINFYKDDSRNNLIDLNNYFYALSEINYSIIESPNNNQIELIINNFTKNISISVLDGAWFGTQQFNLTASTEGGDSLTTTFSLLILNETKPVLNYAPEFNEVECGEFSWNKNTNKTIDMDSCWDDKDGENLEYDYSELNSYKKNISILTLSGNRLIFIPGPDFNGSTYLTFYANDSHVRVNHRVYLYILGNNTNVSLPTPSSPNNLMPSLELKSSNPAGSKVSFFINESKVFSIIAENYDLVEWYVDGVLVKEGALSYIFEETRLGVYSIEARITKGAIMEKKVWEVSIEEDEYIEEKFFDVSVGQVVFYSMLVVLIIVILLILWLLIVERKRKARRIDLGFGVSVVPNRSGFNESSKQFNIPKD